MHGRLFLALVGLAAVAALAAAAPAPQPDAAEHHLAKRGFRHFMHNVKDKVSHAAHKLAPNLGKLKDCLLKTPGLKGAAVGVVQGCVSSAAGGMGSVAACAAKKGALPAARATAHLAACMG